MYSDEFASECFSGLEKLLKGSWLLHFLNLVLNLDSLFETTETEICKMISQIDRLSVFGQSDTCNSESNLNTEIQTREKQEQMKRFANILVI